MRSQRAIARSLVTACVLVIVFGNTPASAQDVVKIGFSAPITGPPIRRERQANVSRPEAFHRAERHVTVPIAQWASKNGITRVVTLVSDYAPGLETEKAFIDEFKATGGEIIESLRVPLQNPDFAPYLQRARDAKPEALFFWVPGGLAAAFLRQYAERGVNASGIKLIGTGDIGDDDVLNQMGDPVIGATASLQYSAAHPSVKNKAFVEGFKRVTTGLRPDHVGVAAYDCMYLIHEALKKTGGKTDGDALIVAMKGMTWESPRGVITVDPETRDLIQDVYIRRVERVDGEWYNLEFDKYETVKDPGRTAQAK
jgi:branched-chain amino acid transport system substrate-binding protein